MDSFDIKTREQNQFVDITGRVRDCVRAAGVRQGICVVYCPHTTAAITVNENADPDVVHDMLSWLSRAVPRRQTEFRHAEGNSDAHIKSSLVGTSATLIIEDGDIVLGRWQGVFFCEFDGPRTRQVHVRTVRHVA